MDITVSVILPNYNHGKFLSQRIESILYQTYTNFELIILDDASTDDSASIIEKYRGHEKVSTIVYNERNSGSTFKQWEKGIKLAKGELIWIAESDDYADPTFLEQTTKAILSSEDINLCFAQSYRVNSKSEIKENCLNWYGKDFKAPFIIEGKDYIKKYLWDANTIYNASAVLFRKKAYPINDKTICKLKFVGDWFVYIKLIEHGKLAYLPEPLNYFRFHESSVTTKFNNSKLHLFENYFILKYISEQRLYDLKEKYNTRLNYLAGLILTRNLSFSEVRKMINYAIKFDPYLMLRLLSIRIKLLFKKAN